jgi:FkbM family methyltransferase
MKLKELQDQYLQGNISKEYYIQQMHEKHKILWEYQELIQHKNVSEIKITKDQIILTAENGVSMLCNPVDKRIVPIEILNFGDHEAVELGMIKNFLNWDDVCLDIGANIGWYSLNLSHHVPKGWVYAFEPLPKTFEYLKANIKLNNFGNVGVYNFGLSDEAGHLNFYYYDTLSGASSSQELYPEKEKTLVRCPVQKLDNFASRIPRIDFIKCDVEGAELFVIKGSIKTLEKHNPILFIEMLRKWSAKFDYHPNDIIKLLDGIGYDCYAVEGETLKKITEVDEQTTATNFFFFHRQTHKELMPIIHGFESKPLKDGQ